MIFTYCCNHSKLGYRKIGGFQCLLVRTSHRNYLYETTSKISRLQSFVSCLPLKKATYDLKQYSRSWLSMFTSHIQKIGFMHSKADHSLFLHSKSNKLIYFLIYVNDILILENNSEFLHQIISYLQNSFQLWNLGGINYFLSIQIDRSREGLFIHQTKYTTNLIQKAGFT